MVADLGLSLDDLADDAEGKVRHGARLTVPDSVSEAPGCTRAMVLTRTGRDVRSRGRITGREEESGREKQSCAVEHGGT